MDPRTGELTALGIVEVPEGMPLSEGATRARQARRLLQKVLDYVPEGTVIHPLVRIGRHAAAGIVEAAAEQEADLMIFGWGGKSGPNRDAHGPVISPTIDEVVRESPCDIAVVKQRGARDIRRILVPVRGGPHAELALRFADALAHRFDATVCVMHVVPAGVTEAVRAQAEHALAAFSRQHVTARSEPILRETANVRTAILREAERADLVVMGASAPPGEPGTSLFGALPEAIAQRAKPTVIVVKTREPIGRQTFEQLAQKAETLAAADRAAEESRAVPARVERWFAEANFHHSEFADLARLTSLKEKQGLTVSLVLPTLDESETDRADRPASRQGDAGALPAARRDPGHRLRVHGRHPGDRRGRGRAGGPAPRRADPLRVVPSARARPSGSRSTRPAATSSSGPTPTCATGTRGWSTGRSARCSSSRASST